MFKVKNVSNGSVALSLEKGSTFIGKNASLDLDGLCSRKWIRENKELNQLLNPSANMLILLHDSEVGVRPQITHDTRKNIPKTKPKKKEKPVIIDFSDVGEPEQDDPIVEDLSEPEPEDVVEVVEAQVEDQEAPKYPENPEDAEMLLEEPVGAQVDALKLKKALEEALENVEEPVEEDTDVEMLLEEPTWEDEVKEELPDGGVKCSICGKLCKGERGLKMHMRRAHGE